MDDALKQVRTNATREFLQFSISGGRSNYRKNFQFYQIPCSHLFIPSADEFEIKCWCLGMLEGLNTW